MPWVTEENRQIVTLVITGIAAFCTIVIQWSMRRIALQQAETARQAKEVATAKLNLDLFEKRLVIFKHACSIIGYAAAGEPYEFAKLGMLQNKLHEAGFLFGKDIEDYLLALHSKAIKEQQLLIKIKNEKMYVDQTVIDQHKELKEWFLKESEGIKIPFRPYMSFDKWRA